MSWRFVAILGSLLATITGHAQDVPPWLFKNRMLLDNMVSVRSDLPKGQGFGFVLAERDDTLYIATAAHVVHGGYDKGFSRGISIAYATGNQEIPATGRHLSGDYDLALLAVPAGEGQKFWTFRSTIADAKEGDKVGIVGQRGMFQPTHRRLRGTVREVRGDTIHTDLYEIVEGASGGPLLNKKGIVGLVVASYDAESGGGAALPIGVVMSESRALLGMSPRERDLPYLSWGTSFDISASARFRNDGLSFLTAKELYAELAAAPMWTLHYGWTSFKSHSTQGDTASYDFRNRFGGHTFSVNHDIVKNLHPVSVGIGLGGYVLTRVRPELRVEGDDWIPFDDVRAYGGSDRPLGWFVDVEAEITFDFGLAVNVGVTLKQFNDEFLVVRPWDPLGDNQQRLLWLGLGLGLSYKVGWAEGGRVKMLR